MDTPIVADSPANAQEQTHAQVTDYIAVGIIKLIELYSRYPELIECIQTVLCSNPTHVVTWVSVWERASINEWRHLSHAQVTTLMRSCKTRTDRIRLQLVEDNNTAAIEIKHCRNADLIRVDYGCQKLLKYKVQQNPAHQRAEIICVEEVPFCDLN